MCKFFSILDISYFGDEAFTKREAWNWLLSNATNNKILCSIRQMAAYWQWHKSKVERFINRLKAESLIETEIKSGKLLISVNHCAPCETTKPNLETHNETISRQNRDIRLEQKPEQGNAEDVLKPQNGGLGPEAETEAGQIRNGKEEKKKRSKKRKEERFFKEKNISFGDIKKEKRENVFVPFNLVKEKDVEQWITETLQVPMNITWELEKFKDYWLSTRKKPPKDGIAAFRNWLRKSIEINNKYGGKSEQFNRTSGVSINKEPTGFERFLTGGLRAVDKFG